MKNKKIIIIFATVLLILTLIIISLDNHWFSKNKPFNKTSSIEVYPTAASQEHWSDITPKKKKIVPVFMTDKDKEVLNISTSTKVNPEKIQILKRDANGKILEYKLIHTDADLVTSE